MRDILLGDIQTKIYRSHVMWVVNRLSLVDASPTCTPPPICTLAPFPIPRWSQDRGRRWRLKEYTMRKDSQRNWFRLEASKNLTSVNAARDLFTGYEASFWIRAQIRKRPVSCDNSRSPPKIFYKSVTRATRGVIFQMLVIAMSISD